MISDSLLQGVYLFTDLNADERASLAKIAEEMTLPAGFPIFRAGDPATALYLIKDGSVRLTVTSSGGKSIDVATLGSGSHFGEMALIDGAKRSADCGDPRADVHVPIRLRQDHGAARPIAGDRGQVLSLTVALPVQSLASDDHRHDLRAGEESAPFLG